MPGWVIGAVILKHKLNLSDKETVLQIQENPYLQYFFGFSRYKDEQPFAPSLFVEIRKRMEADVFACFERVILERIGMAKTKAVEGSDGNEAEEAWINSIFLVMNLMVLLRKRYDELINLVRNKFYVVLQTYLTQMIAILLSIFKLPRIMVRHC